MTVLRARPVAARTHPCRRSAADRGSPIRIRAGAWSVVTIARCTRSRGGTSSDASNRSCARPGSPAYSSHTPSKPRRCPDPKLLPTGRRRPAPQGRTRPDRAPHALGVPSRPERQPPPPRVRPRHLRLQERTEEHVKSMVAWLLVSARRRGGRAGTGLRTTTADGCWAACAQPSGWPSGAAWWPGTSPSTSPSPARPGRLTRLHEARHSCLTFLAMNGVPDTVLAAWAGHTNAGFTKRVYVHPTADDMRSASAQLEALLGFKDGPSRPAV